MSTPPSAELQAALDRATDTARAAWPGLEVEPATFARWLRERSAPSSEHAGPAAAIQRLAVGDLYLCCAILAGEPRAMAAFDLLLGVAAAALARIGGDTTFADEVQQRVRIKLLVADDDGGEPRLSTYRGEGDLRAFLRVLLVREGLDLRRRRTRHEQHASRAGEETSALGAAVDPEIAHLRRQLGPELERAFADAITALAPAERTLLRYHYVDRLNIDQIGALENIHRVSAARRLTRLRGALIEETRRLLRERLRVTPDELVSALRVLESDLHVSVRRLLG